MHADQFSLIAEALRAIYLDSRHFECSTLVSSRGFRSIESRFLELGANYRLLVNYHFVTEEFCMDLRPTYMNENRGEPKSYDGTGVGRQRPSLLWIG